jgi:biopolymer transport protein TolR
MSTDIRPNINITPLIDILLVLLVIFIATVTVKQQAIESQVPPATQGPGEAPPGRIMIEVAANRGLRVNSQSVEWRRLEPFLRDVYDTRADKILYVSAAGSLPYGAVIDVMDRAKGAGVERFGMITDGMRKAAGVPPKTQ